MHKKFHENRSLVEKNISSEFVLRIIFRMTKNDKIFSAFSIHDPRVKF